MADGRELRSRNNRDTANKATIENKKQPKAAVDNNNTAGSTSTAVPKVVAKNKSVALRASITTANSRLSTSSRTSTSSTKDISEEKIKSLEARLAALEVSLNALVDENAELKLTVTILQSEVSQLKDQSVQRQLSSENTTSSNQQEINTNIVIRGVDVNDNTPADELTAIFEGIRNHLGISGIAELTPVSVSLIAPKTSKPNSAFRPIKVVLPSVDAKVKFLQIRRTKKDIVQSDIGISSHPNRPVLITEQLTRTNQELLFQARSLRERGNYKFVWSKNGEILARHKPNSKVIKILDTAHVNSLRKELNLEPVSNNGRLPSNTTQTSSSSFSAI